MKDNWCWAAVTVSVMRFLRGETRTQCDHANRVLGRGTCCGEDLECDTPASLRDSLRTADVLAEYAEAQMSLSEIRRHVSRGRPVCVRIGWDGGGGHFVVIDAVFANDQLRVDDPSTGETVLTYAALQRYQEAGDWTHTYTTKP